MVLDFWAGVFVGYIVGGIFGIHGAASQSLIEPPAVPSGLTLPTGQSYLLMALTMALDEGDD